MPCLFHSIQIIPGGVVDGSYTYVNCYNNNDNFPLELFDHAAAQDDASLSVEVRC